MDFTALTPALTPRGEQLTGQQADQAITALDDDENWDTAGIDEIDSDEAHGVATAAFRTPFGLLVAVREFTHTVEQHQAAKKLIAAYRDESNIDIEDVPLERLVGVGDDAKTVAVYGRYEDEESATLDARRLLLRSVIDADAQLQAVGWDANAVILARGANYFLVYRTHPDGQITVEYEEKALDAYVRYASVVEELASEMSDELRGMHREVVSAWLRKESAYALTEQARLTLSFALRSFGLAPTMSTAELARGLYTDRGNLSRAIAKAAKAR